MNSAQLYAELLACGDRLFSALACEKKANIFSPEDLSYTRWQYRLRMARQKVEHEAEVYAIALKAYRVTMLAEVAPSALATARRLGRTEENRERVWPFSACNGRMHRSAKPQ